MTAKEEILSIALRLFTEEGYENTGVARIVAEAGVTKPTLYHHFGNKDGLLASILQVYGQGLRALFKDALEYQGDVLGSIDRLVIDYMHYVKKNPMSFRLYKQLYQSPVSSDSYRLVKPLYEDIHQQVETFFASVADHHTGLKEKESWMAFSLIGLMDTYMLHHMKQDGLDSITDDTCRQVAKQFLYGVFA